jgi:electron transfer flavoprotein alpha subunit
MQKKSEVLLLADDDSGRELAPRLAHSLDGAVVTEVVGLEAEGTNLLRSAETWLHNRPHCSVRGEGPRPCTEQNARARPSPRTPTERGGPPPLVGLSPGLCGPGGSVDIIADRTVTFRRQLYGGRCLGSFAPQRRPVIVTVKLRSQAPAAERPGRPVPVEELSVSLAPSLIRAKVVERVTEDVRGVKLENARVVVSGGRGLKGPEPYCSRDLGGHSARGGDE